MKDVNYFIEQFKELNKEEKNIIDSDSEIEKENFYMKRNNVAYEFMSLMVNDKEFREEFAEFQRSNFLEVNYYKEDSMYYDKIKIEIEKEPESDHISTFTILPPIIAEMDKATHNNFLEKFIIENITHTYEDPIEEYIPEIDEYRGHYQFDYQGNPIISDNKQAHIELKDIFYDLLNTAEHFYYYMPKVSEKILESELFNKEKSPVIKEAINILLNNSIYPAEKTEAFTINDVCFSIKDNNEIEKNYTIGLDVNVDEASVDAVKFATSIKNAYEKIIEEMALKGEAIKEAYDNAVKYSDISIIEFPFDQHATFDFHIVDERTEKNNEIQVYKNEILFSGNKEVVNALEEKFGGWNREEYWCIDNNDCDKLPSVQEIMEVFEKTYDRDTINKETENLNRDQFIEKDSEEYSYNLI